MLLPRQSCLQWSWQLHGQVCEPGRCVAGVQACMSNVCQAVLAECFQAFDRPCPLLAFIGTVACVVAELAWLVVRFALAGGVLLLVRCSDGHAVDNLPGPAITACTAPWLAHCTGCRRPDATVPGGGHSHTIAGRSHMAAPQFNLQGAVHPLCPHAAMLDMMCTAYAM